MFICVFIPPRIFGTKYITLLEIKWWFLFAGIYFYFWLKNVVVFLEWIAFGQSDTEMILKGQKLKKQYKKTLSLY